MRGKIAEIFESIQGEGIYVGERMVFVRSYGCNLKCGFCDTELKNYQEYSPEDLAAKLIPHRKKCRFVSFTGGEPLLQSEFLKQTAELTHKHDYTNYLETNGTLHEELEDVIDNMDVISMDIKLPSSTGGDAFWDEHRKFLELASYKEVFIKAVICESTLDKDINECINIINDLNSHAVLVLQPNSRQNYCRIKPKIDEYRRLCEDSHITTCIIPQMHKKAGIK